ncbi:hypothetical protein LSTR_LSTR012570 [Laodelphax striatellus]|uniref:Uncharacterized protein n=1 Tax=Laodelphax striatellus TaxID=195883 RepID=A0A482WPD4_LAOST|nr:hypothetical protein LSTR_LSTR012570 [Laodelphax striatellus]
MEELTWAKIAYFDKCTTEVEKQAAGYELKGVELAESADFSAALDAFTRSIETAPHRPSGFNNRAQVYRIQGDIQG